MVGRGEMITTPLAECSSRGKLRLCCNSAPVKSRKSLGGRFKEDSLSSGCFQSSHATGNGKVAPNSLHFSPGGSN